MIARLARFANDCYHIWKSPTGSKLAILSGLVLAGNNRMGFKISHMDNATFEYLYREIFVRQSYYFMADKECPVILDCGANIGMASLYFKWLYPKCQLQAFEPDPATFGTLQHNVLQNRLDIETHNCALWDDDTEVDFFVDSATPGGLVMSTNASRSYRESIKVPARKLSDFIIGPVDFLKLDVEGAEFRVIFDLVRSGKLANIRQMVIEYHHQIGQQKSRLASFLRELELAGFNYQIQALLYPLTSKNVYQDLLIAAYQ
jgi:FkbM family methyltransferase